MNKLIFLLRNPFTFIGSILSRFPYFSFIRLTPDYQNGASFKKWFNQKILNSGENKAAYWPVNPTSRVLSPENILVGIDAYPGYMGGNYIQGTGGIYIGDYTQIAPNVSIVSSNHDLYDSRKHINKSVKIGKYCWIGAGAVILPGVELGDFTIVGAGSVVTKSFAEGYCLIGGNTASLIKSLEKEKCIPFENKHKFNGFIASDKFDEYRKKKLTI
jgi:acetyltransferase-like isoleucine patch superfamily enzyme